MAGQIRMLPTAGPLNQFRKYLTAMMRSQQQKHTGGSGGASALRRTIASKNSRGVNWWA